MRLPRPDTSKCEEYGYEYEQERNTYTGAEKAIIAAILALCLVAYVAARYLPVRLPF